MDGGFIVCLLISLSLRSLMGQVKSRLEELPEGLWMANGVGMGAMLGTACTRCHP